MKTFRIIGSPKPKQVKQKAETTALGLEVIKALDSLDDSVIILDKDWRYLFVNKAGWKVLARDKQEVLGHNVWKLFPNLEGTKFKRIAIASMKGQKKIDIEEYYPHRKQWYGIKFFPSKNTLVVHITDITALKLAERLNTELMGDLQDAMEVYWSEENRTLREKRKKQKRKK